MDSQLRGSPLALTVLSLLHAAPLHPYGIQRLLKAWGKDQVVNIGQRASLYKVIERLTASGLVAVRHTEREQQYPERTVYEITEAGRATCRRWLEEMLATPRNQFPDFPAALSSIMLLEPTMARSVLETRATAIARTVEKLTAELAGAGSWLPRVTVVETEYALALAKAEATWLDGIIADLTSGALTWTEQMLEQAGTLVTD